MRTFLSGFMAKIDFDKAKRKKEREISHIPPEWQKLFAQAGFIIDSVNGYSIESDMYFDVSRQGLLLRHIYYRHHVWCEIGWEKRPGMLLDYSLVLQYLHVPNRNIPDDFDQMIHYIFGPENFAALKQMQSIIEQDGFIGLARGIAALQRNECFIP